MKILINTPDYQNPSLGGVSAFYHGMQGYWNETIMYNVVARRKGISGAIWFPWDMLKFVTKILVWQPNVIMVNPSLFINALQRDFTFLNIARFFGKPVVVLMHGFNLEVAMTINHQWVSKNLNKASLVMVLANQFRNLLQSWDVKVPIELITTKVEDRMLSGFDINSRTGRVKNILFLSRMVKEKGVYETLDTFKILKDKHPHLNLIMVGDGKELDYLKEYVVKNDIRDVTFTGALSGNDRLKAYRNADFFFFFTRYGEGLPTVVLEAMAFGLPVITRTVGGLVDFFEDGRMGRITDSLEPNIFAEMMERYITDQKLTLSTSLYNHNYALEHFMATKVGRKIEGFIARYARSC